MHDRGRLQRTAISHIYSLRITNHPCFLSRHRLHCGLPFFPERGTRDGKLCACTWADCDLPGLKGTGVEAKGTELSRLDIRDCKLAELQIGRLVGSVT